MFYVSTLIVLPSNLIVLPIESDSFTNQILFCNKLRTVRERRRQGWRAASQSQAMPPPPRRHSPLSGRLCRSRQPSFFVVQVNPIFLSFSQPDSVVQVAPPPPFPLIIGGVSQVIQHELGKLTKQKCRTDLVYLFIPHRIFPGPWRFPTVGSYGMSTCEPSESSNSTSPVVGQSAQESCVADSTGVPRS